tara:strand:- start:1936 stop:2355 length:420 start_codon:yes stop_codon:yes gene_type:complete
MNKFLIFFLLCFLSSDLLAKEKDSHFNKGKKYYEKKNFEQAKLSFEKDIVRNTENTNSYLYLAKIYEIKNNNKEFEKNLKTVLILDPKNEEALYLLIKKKIKDADYDFAKEKYKIFIKYCRKLCTKKNEIDRLLKKSKS